MFDFEMSQHLGFTFYRSNSLRLFCSPLHVHYITTNHSFDFKEVIGKILIDFSLRPLNHSDLDRIAVP